MGNSLPEDLQEQPAAVYLRIARMIRKGKGEEFSILRKNREIFVHCVENSQTFFPLCGKIQADFPHLEKQ
jgi:hypothetical protein